MAAGLATSLTMLVGSAVAADAPSDASGRVIATATTASDRVPSAANIVDDATIDAETHAASNRVDSKSGVASPPNSDRFVLLGLGVVLVGAIARQRRRYRRSGTIMLR